MEDTFIEATWSSVDVSYPQIDCVVRCSSEIYTRQHNALYNCQTLGKGIENTAGKISADNKSGVSIVALPVGRTWHRSNSAMFRVQSMAHPRAALRLLLFISSGRTCGHCLVICIFSRHQRVAQFVINEVSKRLLHLGCCCCLLKGASCVKAPKIKCWKRNACRKNLHCFIAANLTSLVQCIRRPVFFLCALCLLSFPDFQTFRLSAFLFCHSTWFVVVVVVGVASPVDFD